MHAKDWENTQKCHMKIREYCCFQQPLCFSFVDCLLMFRDATLLFFLRVTLHLPLGSPACSKSPDSPVLLSNPQNTEAFKTSDKLNFSHPGSRNFCNWLKASVNGELISSLRVNQNMSSEAKSHQLIALPLCFLFSWIIAVVFPTEFSAKHVKLLLRSFSVTSFKVAT